MTGGLFRKVGGVLGMLVAVTAHAGSAMADVTAKAGEPCPQPGAIASGVDQSVLACAKGTWQQSKAKPASFVFEIDARDKDGRLVFGSGSTSVAELAFAQFGSWTEVGQPVLGANGSLTAVKTRMGEWGSLMPILTADGSVHLVGKLTHADRQSSWSSDIDSVVEPGQDKVVASRPDGVTYHVRIEKAQD